MKFEWKKKRGKHICMLCGGCIVSCPNQALKFSKSKNYIALTSDEEIIHDPKKCSWCGMCVKVCPEGMIKIKK